MNNYVFEAAHLFLKVYNDNELTHDDKCEYVDTIGMILVLVENCIIAEVDPNIFKRDLLRLLEKE